MGVDGQSSLGKRKVASSLSKGKVAPRSKPRRKGNAGSKEHAVPSVSQCFLPHAHTVASRCARGRSPSGCRCAGENSRRSVARGAVIRVNASRTAHPCLLKLLVWKGESDRRRILETIPRDDHRVKTLSFR
jgi:hypothetical protein